MNTVDVAVTAEPFGRVRGRRSLTAQVVASFTRNKGSLIGALVLAVLLVVVVAGPLIAPYDPTEQILTVAKKGPSAAHLLGTDQFGRDILSRVIVGARNTLGMPFLAIGFALVLGVIPGLVAGYAGGWVDSLIMRLVDILLAFPGILLALMIVAMLGTGMVNIMLAIGVSLIPVYVRMARGSTLSIRNEPYVDAARVLGSSDIRLLFRHVLPNLYGPLIVLSTTAIGWGILAGAALNFLGLGVQPPTPEWGRDLADGRNYLVTAWWITTFPGLVTMVTILAVNLVGDALTAVLDPMLRSR
ncbi:MAG TPA: ABC transporter permease [Thermomicrobiaceae bacterium]|nr:ABC transporter permease [Thermomicrobiaceae bacterium]